MTLTHEHEHLAYFLGRLVIAWTEERALAITSGGSTTFRRSRRRGLGPDECYWIANEARVRKRNRIDLRRDPPPDRAIEVDVTHSSVPRMPVYAALGVPEVWRWSGNVLTFGILQPDGTYAPATGSQALPSLPVTDVSRFLTLRGQTDENDAIREFRAWLRQLPGPPVQP